ncbi:MAG: beta-ketoacyl-ACP synthase III [Acetivibrio sp.]
MVGKICGTGSYVPPKYLDNKDLSKMVDTNDEWIQERTGIIRRHIIDEDTTVTMAVKAAKKALLKGETKAEEIELILLSTFSSNVLLPCGACEVQKEIGAINAVCFDINAACSGFLFAYNTAQAYIAGGIYKKILIIGSESLSNLVDWRDRGTCILFGDGAGAVVLQAEEGENYPFTAYSAGENGSALTCENRYNKNWEEKEKSGDHYMKMDGQAVFKFALRKVPESIGELLKKNRLTVENIDYFILHQANRRIVTSIAKKLELSIEKFPMNLEEYGNTSSASIPILLDEMNEKGLLKKNRWIVLAGFGAGLSWGASLLKW